MIPILYEPSERRFLTNGICRLSSCTRCVCTEERNGIYEVEFDFPVDGEHYSEIKLGRIIAATHDDTGDIQPFDIYAKSAPIDGVVTFHAHHISYRLSDIVVMPYEASSCADALTRIPFNSANTNPFSFWTDKVSSTRFSLKQPKNARNILAGEAGSILDVYGKGDYQFDKFNVRLYTNRGVDSGVTIRYGKNMTDLTYKEDRSDTYNAVVPFWLDSQTGEIITLPEKVIVFSGAEPVVGYLTDEDLLVIRTETGEPIEVAFKMIDAVPMDLSSDFQEQPTVAQLREAATTKFQASYAWLPSQTVDVDFVQLWQTEEYKDYAPLQRVRLCDTVSVYYPKLGVEAVKEKVIKTVYNVLLDRYDSIELGTPQTTLAGAMTGTIEEMIQDLPTVNFMEKAIEYATEMITGNQGGYVVLKSNANGQPEEFLILDNEDINQAVNVWRWNASGLGHSHNGYNGPYDDVAITMDGAINANAITVGNLWANLITAGKITSANGLVYFDLDNNELACNKVVGTGATADIGGVKAGNIYYPYFKVIDTRLSEAYGAVQIEAASNVTAAKVVASTDPFGFGIRRHATYGDFEGGASNQYLNFTANRTELIQHRLNGICIGEGGAVMIMARTLGASTYDGYVEIDAAETDVTGAFTVRGTKSRLLDTQNYQDRLMYAYETPTPLFGDIGEAQLDEEGLCYVDLDDIFSETIASKVEYQVFLQKEGDGDCWVADKQQRYFVIKGTPGLRVAWELKAKQKDYELFRLERYQSMEDRQAEYANYSDDNLFEEFINEQEELLYG